MMHLSLSRKTFLCCNAFLLTLLAILCLAPVINCLALSLSGSQAIASGKVTFWPLDFSLSSYRYILSQHLFGRSFFNSCMRLLLGTVIQMLITIICAYPLSKETRDFRLRSVYMWFFVFTMLFSGGLIPAYLQIRQLNILDTIWALILPGAVCVYNIILLMNAFRSLPRELEESFYVDGASHHHVLWRLNVPLAMPSVATILLFTMVGHWNSWFDGMIYMNHTEKFPLATYLHSVVVNFDFKNMTYEQVKQASEITTRSSKCSQIIVGMLPILCVYPFLQRFFVKGLVMGSVKG